MILKHHEFLWARIIENSSKSILKCDLVGIQEVRSNGGGDTETISDIRTPFCGNGINKYYSRSGFFVQKRDILPIGAGWFVSEMSYAVSY